MKHFFHFVFLAVTLWGVTACSAPADKNMLHCERSLTIADSLVQAGMADSARATQLLSDLHREYALVKDLSGGKRVRLTSPDATKRFLWITFTALMIGLNVWLSIGNIKFSNYRKHRRYLVDLSENEQRLRNNERERDELKECLDEMSLTDEEREEVRLSLVNLIEHGNLLHKENETLLTRLQEFEKRPPSRDLELLKEQTDRLRLQEEQINALTATLIDRDEVVERLRRQPKFLTDTDWEHLRHLADRVYDNFSRKLSERFPQLTPADLQLCLLIRLRFANPDIATLTAVSPASVSQQKFRLKKRLQQADEALFKNGETVDMVVWSC